MRRRPWILLASTLVVFALFAMNAVGWSVYLYLTVGSKDVIFAAAQGVAHAALADTMEPVTGGPLAGYFNEVKSEFVVDLIHAGPINLFLERASMHHAFRFHVMDESGYLGVEFPWLLLLIAFVLLTYWRWKAMARATEPDEDALAVEGA
ncbi:MAG: hypothetical protein AAF586_02960 [Planctomycetota bacterium]